MSIDEPGWVDGPGGGGRFAVFPLGEGDHDPLVVVVEYAADTEIGVHAHASDYSSMVVSGRVEVTRRHEEVGSIRHVRAGTAYGPLVIGPEGATVVEVFADRTTFSAPDYLAASDREAAAASPMPELARRAIAAVWATR